MKDTNAPEGISPHPVESSAINLSPSLDPSSPFAPRLSSLVEKLRLNLASVFLGKGDVIQLAMVAVLAEGHILIEDVPGVGKTLLAKAPCAQPRLHLPPHPVHA